MLINYISKSCALIDIGHDFVFIINVYGNAGMCGTHCIGVLIYVHVQIKLICGTCTQARVSLYYLKRSDNMHVYYQEEAVS